MGLRLKAELTNWDGKTLGPEVQLIDKDADSAEEVLDLMITAMKSLGFMETSINEAVLGAADQIEGMVALEKKV